MIVGHTRGRAFQRLLVREAGTDGDARAVAAAARRLCEHFARQLTPLIGAAGAAAICARGLHLTQRQFPSVVPSLTSEQPDGPFTRIQATLELQEPAVATQVAIAVLNTTADLLTSSIGESLATRLLRETCPHEFAGDNPVETT